MDDWEAIATHTPLTVTTGLCGLGCIQKAAFGCCRAGVDLEDEGTGKGPKVRGMSDAKLAKKLRAELKAMLSQPLRQRMNSKFFTGGTSQIVAQSVAASRGPAQTRHGGSDGTGSQQEAVVNAVAMRASVAEAARVVQQRVGPQEGAAAPAAKKKKRKHKAMTLAEHQAAALQTAVAAKRMKKAAKVVQGGVYVPRDLGGQNALAAIRGASGAKS